MLFLDDPVLRVGDRIRIVCPEEPELCVDRTIGPDGTLDIPRLGPLPAAIRRLSELTDKIESRLPGDLYPPHVELQLLGSGLVGIQGAVSHALRFYAPRGISSDRLFAAAELLPEADLALLGTSRRFRAGAQVVVPSITADRRISVLGAVVNPTALPPSNDLTLGMAIEAVGGLSPHADGNNVIIVRQGESIAAQLPADTGLKLQPGDLVRIGLTVSRHYVIVRGLVAHPGSVEYAPGMTAMRALTAAGGLQDKAKTGTLIWQTGPKTFRLSLTFLLNGRIPDPVIGPEDTLTVEVKA